MINKKVLGVAIAAASLMSVAQAEVKIGFLGGFTGPIESLTPPIFEGAKVAIAQVNVQGGILDGDILTMPSADTTCVDASAASNGADRLINSDGVIAIVGGLCSGATIAAANNVAVPAGVPMVSPASTSPALTGLDDNDLVFRTAPSDAYQGEMLAKLLASKGIDEIAITYVNNDYGKGFADALEANFKGTVTANEAHEDGKADYRAELGSLASTGTQTLVVLAYADGSGQTILRQAYEAGDFTTFVGGDGMVGQALVDAVGADVLDGMIATKPGIPDVPGLDAFEQASRAEPLVWDKWLALTAMRALDSTIGRIRSIYLRSDFPRTNPNRMYSLIGSFVMNNQSQFTRPDGAGFELLAGLIAELDPINPKLAARMMVGFRTVQMLEPKRRAVAESTLTDLAGIDNLSTDVSEILHRILDGLEKISPT